MYKSSPPDVFLGKGVLKICSEFTGKDPCWSVKTFKTWGGPWRGTSELRAEQSP